ncbi:MAG: hypothetical protein AB8I08_32315 [Sandaracinaceae bacterium]
MNVFHLLQSVLGVAVLVWVGLRVFRLSFAASLDAGPFRRALVELVRNDRHEQAKELVRAAMPSLAAQPLWPLFDPDAEDDERVLLAQEALMGVESIVVRGMRPLRIGASVASALGFLGAAFQIWWIFNGEHGLESLIAGRVENQGFQAAVLSVAIGIATSSFALGSWTVLKTVAKERLAEARRMLPSVEEAFERAATKDAGSAEVAPS